MAGPWEQYAPAAQAERGPWESYRAPVEPVTLGKEGFAKTLKDEYGKLNWADRQLIGAGTALSNAWEGAKQIVGKGDPSRIEANRVIEKENPGAAFVGNAALFAPTAMIPGANTYTGSALIGAGMGALQPTAGDESRLKNTAIGGGFGLAGKALGDVVSRAVTSKEASEASAKLRDALKNKTLEEGQAAGYVVPQSAVNPSFLSNRLESIGGKAAMGQQAAIKNQEVTNKLARAAAGLAEDEPISLTSLKAARDRLSAPYQEVSKLSPVAEGALKDWKESNKLAQQWYKAYERLPIPTLQDKAERFAQKAVLAEQRMEQEAVAAGRNDLLPALKQARVALAKNFDVERAVNLGSGEVDASVIGRALDSGKPLTGELATIGKMQQAFRPYMREGGLVPTPGVSKSEALAGALLGSVGAAAHGPAGVVAGGLPLISSPVRNMMLSNWYQDAVVRPQYGVGTVDKLARFLAPQMPVAVAGGALEALNQ